MNWIGKAYQDDINAKAWDKYLRDNCVWVLDDFGGNTPWDSAIPTPNLFEIECAAFNDYLMTEIDK